MLEFRPNVGDKVASPCLTAIGSDGQIIDEVIELTDKGFILKNTGLWMYKVVQNWYVVGGVDEQSNQVKE